MFSTGHYNNLFDHDDAFFHDYIYVLRSSFFSIFQLKSSYWINNSKDNINKMDWTYSGNIFRQPVCLALVFFPYSLDPLFPLLSIFKTLAKQYRATAFLQSSQFTFIIFFFKLMMPAKKSIIFRNHVSCNWC